MNTEVQQQQGREDAARGPSGADARRRNPELLEQIVASLRTVFDPEIPTNIFDLGLIYAIDEVEDGVIGIRMTLTAPACPVAGILPGQVEQAVRSVEGVTSCQVELVWDPPWSPDMMSEAARLDLGMV